MKREPKYYYVHTMTKMKHQDGFAPSAEDTAKLNEIVGWLEDHGFHGIMLIHKGDIGVSWVNEEGADEIRHTLINALGHICDENEEVAREFLKGMVLTINQIKKS